MAYVKTQGGQTTYPYSIGQLRKDNPDISFPKSISDETLATYGVYSVVEIGAPPYDESTQKVEQDTSPTEVAGAWELRWSVSSLSPTEMSLMLKMKAAEVRGKRDELMASSDWTQLPDAAVDKSTWIVYRQELRDITQQSGFPINVNWPVKPTE